MGGENSRKSRDSNIGMDPSDEVAANTTSMKFCLLSSFFLKIAITLVAE